MSLSTVVPMLEILRLRAGPQDLPPDQGVLVFWMGASVFSGILIAAPMYGVGASLFLSVLDLAVLYLFVLVVLRLQGKAERWVQTYTAMVGVSALLVLAKASVRSAAACSTSSRLLPSSSKPPRRRCCPATCRWPSRRCTSCSLVKLVATVRRNTSGRGVQELTAISAHITGVAKLDWRSTRVLAARSSCARWSARPSR